MTAPTTTQLRDRAQTYCEAKIVEAVKQGASFLANLSDVERDLLVLMMGDAWCAGAMDALAELVGEQSTDQLRIAAQQRVIRELSARRRAP